MADSFNKKEREKKKEKRRKEKAERKLRQKLEGKKSEEFMYLDENGNLTPIKPDPTKKIKVNAEDIQITVPKKGEEDPIKVGIVKFFNVDKGYGFINQKGSHESFFVSANNLVDPIKDKDKVNFEVEMGPKGPIAVNVKLQK